MGDRGRAAALRVNGNCVPIAADLPDRFAYWTVGNHTTDDARLQLVVRDSADREVSALSGRPLRLRGCQVRVVSETALERHSNWRGGGLVKELEAAGVKIEDLERLADEASAIDGVRPIERYERMSVYDMIASAAASLYKGQADAAEEALRELARRAPGVDMAKVRQVLSQHCAEGRMFHWDLDTLMGASGAPAQQGS